MHKVIPYNYVVSKTLCIRIDRIGDLVLTMSSDFELRARGDDVTWLISRGLSFIAQQAQPPRAFYQVPSGFSWIAFLELVGWLRRQRFDSAIVFHAPMWIYFAVFFSGIPVRAGRWSQWFSFLTLNHGYRQSRKSGERSELFFNFQLVQKCLLGQTKGTEKTHPLKLRPFLNRTELANWGLRTPYVVIHPGMMGSARNWDAQLYRGLAENLMTDYQVVITGTAGDRQYWQPLADHFQGRALCLAEKLSTQDLVGVLGHAALVVAPSTGVVHLAAAAGTATLGLYPPVKNQDPVRWGPKGDKVMTLVPPVDCPAQLDCLMHDCPKFDCMGTFELADLIRTARKHASSERDADGT